LDWTGGGLRGRCGDRQCDRPRYYNNGYYGDYGYGAYAYEPGYVYAPRYRGNYGWYRGCTGDENVDSAYPSWACR